MKRILLIFLIPLFMFSCEKEDRVNYAGTDEVLSTDVIDIYFQKNFQDKYGCAVRWKWVDTYYDRDKVLSPPKRDVVIPVAEMVLDYWIQPFLTLSKEGGDFIRNHFPPEIVLIGSPMRNQDKTVTLGIAEAGVRISISDINTFDIKNDAWIQRQLETLHHEFTHIIHQTYNLPVGYNAVTPTTYTSTAWLDIKTVSNAIKRGMVTPYATSAPAEDFAELVSHYIMEDAAVFASTYLTPTSGSDLNEGKAWIAEKLQIARDYYDINFSIDLDALRDNIQERLKNR